MSPVVRSAGAAVPAIAAVLLILAQIVYPLTAGSARDGVIATIVVLSALTALAHAWVTRGPRYAAGLLLIVSGIGLAAEILGTATGFPFGCYHYAHRLGPQLADVPLLVPLAWTGGLYPVWIAAGLVCSRTRLRIPLAALGAVGWDLFLDPQMVAAGQWNWCAPHPGPPGTDIPYTNYLGWFAVALLMAALLTLLDRVVARPAANPVVPVSVLLWTWLGSTLAHAAFLGLPASAGYGFLGLGTVGIPLLWTLSKTRHNLAPTVRR